MFIHMVVEDINTLDRVLPYRVMHHLALRLEALQQERLEEPGSKKESNPSSDQKIKLTKLF
jgi:hypothetical protein